MSDTKPTAFISQLHGIGDCCFSMGIAKYFIKQGYDILWPVRTQFLDSLKAAYPLINFVDSSTVSQYLFMIKERRMEGDMLIVPIRWSDSIMKVPYKYVMRSKYDMYDLKWEDWKNDAGWVRYPEKEKLLRDFLGIKPKEKYNLINKRFGGDHKVLNIDVNNDYRNIYMTEVMGMTLFDWSGVIENATTLHLVSTSTLYMTEVLDLKCEENHIYSRKPVEQNLDFVSYLFSKPYIRHE